jgi:hypothetical protein
MRYDEVNRSLVVFLLSFAMVVSIVFVIVGAQKVAGSDTPTCIHLTWNENEDNTAYTIVVTWKTATSTSGDNVKYDTVSRGGNPTSYTYSAVGSHHTYSGAGGYFHDVELTGLSENTVYYFICGGDNGWSGERSFRTALDQPKAFRFVAGGDSRSGSSAWPGSRDNVSRAMAKFNPSFVLFEGDFVYSGTSQSEWDNWFAAAQLYWVDNDNLTIPIIPCLGNHDVSGDGGTAYFGQLSLPGNEEWYSYDWGPNLHITVLDTETSVSGAQRDWLAADLAAHENYLWKVVIFHRPPFSGGPDGIDSDVRTYWCPLFDEYHVDLVISGHNHLYERTYPINYTISENTPMPSPENATVYIVSGGWGAPLYTGSDSWAAVGPISTYNFVVIDVFENKTLRLNAVDANGSVIDTFTIYKINMPKVSISPASQVRIPGSTLNYTVTVANIGNVDNDNYVLTVTDNENWAPTLDENRFENVSPGENRTTTLRITIPENAAADINDNISVTVRSQEDTNVTDTATCVAVVKPNLIPGWNLISFWKVSENDTPYNILDGQTYYMWKWSAENKKYVSPLSTAPVELGVGYWIWVGYDRTVTTRGIPVDNYSIDLVAGWNLVGFPVTNENTTPENLFPSQTYYIWKWDAVNKKYVSPLPIAPVELRVGYWIWVDHDQTENIPR